MSAFIFWPCAVVISLFCAMAIKADLVAVWNYRRGLINHNDAFRLVLRCLNEDIEKIFGRSDNDGYYPCVDAIIDRKDPLVVLARVLMMTSLIAVLLLLAALIAYGLNSKPPSSWLLLIAGLLVFGRIGISFWLFISQAKSLSEDSEQFKEYVREEMEELEKLDQNEQKKKLEKWKNLISHKKKRNK